jgi:hypothetical protein
VNVAFILNGIRIAPGKRRIGGRSAFEYSVSISSAALTPV